MGGLKKPLSLKGFNHSSFEPIHWLAKYSLYPRELAVWCFFLVQKTPFYLVQFPHFFITVLHLGLAPAKSPNLVS